MERKVSNAALLRIAPFPVMHIFIFYIRDAHIFKEFRSHLFYDVRLRVSVDRYQHFTETCCHLQRRKDSHTSTLKRREHVPRKHKYLSVKQYGVISQEIVTFRMTLHYWQGKILPLLVRRFHIWI
jgi:hypothetical protein